MGIRSIVVVGLALVGGGVVPGAAIASSPPSGDVDAVDVVDYADPANWVCRPDVDDVCDTGLDSTIVDADGTLVPQPFTPDPEAPIDCFYVYPTISRDPTANSDLVAGDAEERFVAVNQVAPLGEGCRVYAPLYRQVTLSALTGTVTAGPEARELAYSDVVAAWNQYLANDNDGRGVVLVGHSQGAGILTRLLAQHVDTDPAIRPLVVSAYLAGTSVQVPPGSDVGGTFQELPLCRSADQFGCIVTWSTYRSSEPPPTTAFFGYADEGTEAACTNPAALAGGRSPLTSRFPAESSEATDELGAEPTGGLDAAWLDPAAGTIDTPFVTLPGLLTGGCVEWNEHNYLEIDPVSDPGPRADDVPGDLTPDWGMHLVDVNVVMGDLQQLVVTQATAWLAANG